MLEWALPQPSLLDVYLLFQQVSTRHLWYGWLLAISKKRTAFALPAFICSDQSWFTFPILKSPWALAYSPWAFPAKVSLLPDCKLVYLSPSWPKLEACISVILLQTIHITITAWRRKGQNDTNLFRFRGNSNQTSSHFILFACIHLAFQPLCPKTVIRTFSFLDATSTAILN